MEVRGLDGSDKARSHRVSFVGLDVGAVLPLVSGLGGDARVRIGVEIVLVEVALAGDDEGDGLDLVGLGLVESDDLAAADVDSALGEHAHTTLGGGALELVDVVEERLVVDHLVVSDVAITLTGEEEEGGVGVVEGHQHARAVVDDLVGDGLLEGAGIPDGELTVDRAGEASGDDLVLVGEPAAAETLDTLVAEDLTGDGLGAGVDDTELLVTAGRGDEAAVTVPGAGLDDIRVARGGEEVLALLDIPDLHSVVAGAGSEDVVGAGVVVDGADFALVPVEGLDGGGDLLGDAALGDLGDADVAVLRARGDEVLVEGVELDVENGGLVDAHKRGVGDLAGLLEGLDGEDTSTSGLPDETKVLGVDGHKVAIPASAGELGAAVAVLRLGGLSENVPVLGSSNDSARHL